MTTTEKKNVITFNDYTNLMNKLYYRELQIKKNNFPNVQISLQKVQNIKRAITLLALTGLRLCEIQKLTVGELNTILLAKRHKAIPIPNELISTIKMIFKESLTQSNTNLYLISTRNHKNSYLTRNYLQILVNTFVKELGEGYTSNGFRRNLKIEYGLPSPSKLAKKIGVTLSTVLRWHKEQDFSTKK